MTKEELIKQGLIPSDGERKNKEEHDEIKRFLALWENAICEIRAENKARANNAWISHLCDKLENSMVAYAKGNVEYAYFSI